MSANNGQNKLITDILTDDQKELVDRLVADIQKGDLSLLEFVENSRSGLIAREAELRTKTINELCAVLLKLEEQRKSDKIGAQECTTLLVFLLSKVEDSGHLADLLISTIHNLLVNHYDAIENSLQNDQLDQILTVLFANNGVQSYGQRDRILLFAIFDHLLSTYCQQLLALAQRKTIACFVGSAQGEREPRVLLPIFKIHQKLASQITSLGVYAEDMFDLVACYFPLDYEPNKRDKGPKITREMLRRGIEDCMLANRAFAPFCFQLIAEKLVEMDTDAGSDGALIDRQLEICEFFIAACKHFPNIRTILEQNLDDLMTAFRLIFINPAQTPVLIDRSTRTIRASLQAMMQALKGEGEQNVEAIQRGGMVQSTLENIEPFVLQAEMGTMGKALRLVQCLAECGLIPSLVETVVLRALYWLRVLVAGQTLRSQQNREEIAMEALELVPYWLERRLYGNIVGPHHPTTNTASKKEEESADGNEEEEETAIMPLLDVIFALEDDVVIAETDKFLTLKCRVLTSLLLPLSTHSPSSDASSNSNIHAKLFKQSEKKIVEFCRKTFQTIFTMNHSTNTSNASEILQFLAIYNISGLSEPIDDHFYEGCLQQSGSFILNLIPALVFPLPSELAGRRLSTMPSNMVEKSNKEMDSIVTILFRQIFQNEIQQPSAHWIQWTERAVDAIENVAKRLISSGFSIQEFLDQMRMHIETMLKRDIGETEEEIPSTILDQLARLLQRVGSLLRKNVGDTFHAALCDWAMAYCSDGGDGTWQTNGHRHPGHKHNLRPFRIFWLLLIQSKNVNHLTAFLESLLSEARTGEAGDGRWMDDEEGAIFLENALYTLHFALYNRGHQPADGASSTALGQALVRLTEARIQRSGYATTSSSMILKSGEGNEECAADATPPQQQQPFPSPFPSAATTTCPKEQQQGKNQWPIDTAAAAILVNFQLNLVETRALLLANPAAGRVGLRKFFDHFISSTTAPDEAEFLCQYSAMEDLLGFSTPPNDPEQCFYERSLFWRQRVFSEFVPIYVEFFDHTKELAAKRRQLLRLVGPLMKIVAKIPLDSLRDELNQLSPIIVETLPLALLDATKAKQQKQQQWKGKRDNVMDDSSSSLAISVLEGLCLLMAKSPPEEPSNEGGDGGLPLNERLLRSTVLCLSQFLGQKDAAQQQQQQGIAIQVKSLECLEMVAQRFQQPAHKQWLAPLYTPVIRSLTEMTSSRKRFVRHKVANARNAWEMVLG